MQNPRSVSYMWPRVFDLWKVPVFSFLKLGGWRGECPSGLKPWNLTSRFQQQPSEGVLAELQDPFIWHLCLAIWVEWGIWVVLVQFFQIILPAMGVSGSH